MCELILHIFTVLFYLNVTDYVENVKNIVTNSRSFSGEKQTVISVIIHYVMQTANFAISTV